MVNVSDVSRDPSQNPINFFVNTAHSEKTSSRNAPCGFLAYFEKDNNLYIIDYTEECLDFHDLVKFLQRYVRQNGYTDSSSIYIEPKESGLSIQQLRTENKLNVLKVEGDFIKDDKLTRASSVSAIVEAGRVFLIKGAWNDHYMMQVTTFPKAMHDGAADVTVYALNYMKPKTYLFGFI